MSGYPRLGGDEGRVLRPFPIRRLVILGSGLSIYDWLKIGYATQGGHIDEHTQIWGLGAVAATMRCTMAWSIHTPKVNEEVEKLFGKLDNLGIPVIGAEPFGKNGLEYPLGEVVEEFQETYFQNTMAYALAFGKLCEPQSLEIYGCDFNYNGDRAYEGGRCCIEFWLGIFRHRTQRSLVPGPMHVGPSTTLLDLQLRRNEAFYGYGENQPVLDRDAEGKVHLIDFSRPAISQEEFDRRTGMAV